MDGDKARQTVPGADKHNQRNMEMPENRGGRHGGRGASSLADGESHRQPSGASQVHTAEQERTRIQPAGGGQREQAQDVPTGRLGGIPRVLERDGEGEEPVPGEPDDELLRGAGAGARRFPDKPSAGGGGGEAV